MAHSIVTTGIDASGRIWVRVMDAEVFDLIEDELVERHGLEYLYLERRPQSEGPGFYTMTFPGAMRQQVESAIAALNPSELRRIFRINN
ncbi:unnamed protein product, partial [Laminaria digitata]